MFGNPGRVSGQFGGNDGRGEIPVRGAVRVSAHGAQAERARRGARSRARRGLEGYTVVLVNAEYGDQDVKAGILGSRVSVEVKGQVKEGTVQSLAGVTRAGVPIYLVQVAGKLQPFTRDSFVVEQAAADWGFARDD